MSFTIIFYFYRALLRSVSRLDYLCGFVAQPSPTKDSRETNPCVFLRVRSTQRGSSPENKRTAHVSGLGCPRQRAQVGDSNKGAVTCLALRPAPTLPLRLTHADAPPRRPAIWPSPHSSPSQRPGTLDMERANCAPEKTTRDQRDGLPQKTLGVPRHLAPLPRPPASSDSLPKCPGHHWVSHYPGALSSHPGSEDTGQGAPVASEQETRPCPFLVDWPGEEGKPPAPPAPLHPHRPHLRGRGEGDHQCRRLNNDGARPPTGSQHLQGGSKRVSRENLLPVHPQSLQVTISKATVLSPRAREKNSQEGVARGSGGCCRGQRCSAQKETPQCGVPHHQQGHEGGGSATNLNLVPKGQISADVKKMKPSSCK